jgi:hypothetical protein
MPDDVPPKSARGRKTSTTKPVTIRFDVELMARLVDEAPLQRRSVGNLLQKLVADGLDRLADERAVRTVQANYRHLLAGVGHRELLAILAHQEAVLARRRGDPPIPLPPLPPSLRLRRPRRKPTKRGKSRQSRQ